MKLSLFEWVAIVLVAVAAVLAFLFVMERGKVARARADNVACTADRSNFAATQTGNLATIAALQHRLAVLTEARRIEHDAAGKALAVADAVAVQADKRADAAEHQLGQLYASDANARTWGDTGVDAGVAARLPGR